MVGKKQHLREHDEYWTVAPSLHYTLPNAPAFQHRLDWILANVRGKVLDCGCNDGTFSIAIAKVGHEVVGIDILPRLIDRAAEFAIQAGVIDCIQFQVMNVERLKFDRESFDTVVLTETLEHLIKPRKALKGISRILKPGGRVLASVPNGEDKQPTHYNTFTADSLEELLEEFFDIEKLTATIGSIYCVAVRP